MNFDKESEFEEKKCFLSGVGGGWRGSNIHFMYFTDLVSWLFWGPLRQYFSLYRAVSQREEERVEEG